MRTSSIQTLQRLFITLMCSDTSSSMSRVHWISSCLLDPIGTKSTLSLRYVQCDCLLHTYVTPCLVCSPECSSLARSRVVVTQATPRHDPSYFLVVCYYFTLIDGEILINPHLSPLLPLPLPPICLQYDISLDTIIHFQTLVPNLEAKFDEQRKAIKANQDFLDQIIGIRSAFMDPSVNYEDLERKAMPITEEKMSKVRTTLKQCMRDWSSAGASERSQCYGPIIRELEAMYPLATDDASSSSSSTSSSSSSPSSSSTSKTMPVASGPRCRDGVRVLVPGAGLSRLTWELAHMGFTSQGNEFSYYMLLASCLILNTFKETNIAKIYPFVHESKNLLRSANQTFSCTIPDVSPADIPAGGAMSMTAGDFLGKISTFFFFFFSFCRRDFK